MWILPWAPEFRGFLPRCFVAQCKQSPSLLCSPPLQTASAGDGVGISCVSLKTSSHRRAPAGSIFFFFFPSPLPPRHADRCRPSDTTARPAPETVGPGFHPRPSSVLPSTPLKPTDPLLATGCGPSAKGSTYIHQC